MTVVDQEVEPVLNPLAGHIVVVGLHGIGLRVIEALVGIGWTVVVVDDGADDRSIRLINEWGVLHIVGNAARREVLESASVSTASSLVCVESNELHTLEVALVAREINSGIRVIVRSSNAPVGEAIGTVTGPGTVLDAAALSAPAFVEATLRRKQHDFELSGETFRVIERTADSTGTLRSEYGDLVPIVVLGDDGEPTICPGRDATVVAGNRVALLGTPRELEAQGLISAQSASRTHVPSGARYGQAPAQPSSGSVRALLQTLFYGADRAFKITLLAVVALTIVASVVIDIGYVNYGPEHMDAVDAVYTTVQTLVTVGYGDFPFGDQPTYLRVFDIALMLVGTALIAILFAQLTDLLISRRLAATFGAQRAGTMRDHIVVIGLGSVGMRVVDELRSHGKRVAVIDNNPKPRNVARARAMNVPVVVGDATESETLQGVNLKHSSAVAILTSDDLANIETGLAVRSQLGERKDAVPTVLRLFDRHLSITVRQTFGFHDVRSTAALAAPWFVAAALGLDVKTSFTVAGQTVMVGRLTVAAGSNLAGLSMLELNAGIRVIAIARGAGSDLEYPPRRDAVLAPGDHAYLIGPHEELLKVLVRNQATS